MGDLELEKQPAETTVVVTLSYFAAVGSLFFNVQPVFVGALAQEFGLDESQLGTVVSAGLGAAFVMLGSSFFWVARVNASRVIFSASIVGAVALLFFTRATDTSAVISCTLVYGGAMGTLMAPTLATLSLTRNPERAFAFAITSMVAVAGVVVLVVPTLVIPVFGFDGMLVLISMLTLAATVLSVLINIDIETLEVSYESARKGLAWITLGAMTIFFFGLNGTWAFLDLFADRIALTQEEAGLAFSLSLFLGAVGSLSASLLTGRISFLLTLGIALSFFLLFIVLITTATGFWTFLTALVVFNVGWNFCLPFLMNATARADAGGRFTALIPAAQTLGGASGSFVAGESLLNLGVTPVYIQLLAGILLAYLIYLVVDRNL